MSTDAIRVERRAAQRFNLQLPVSLRTAMDEREGFGYTQDLSARGAFLFTEVPLAEGDQVELTFVMPSEITLTENARVRASARVLRVVNSSGSASAIAVHFEKYEYLPETTIVREMTGSLSRISALHSSAQDEGMSQHTFRPRPTLVP